MLPKKGTVSRALADGTIDRVNHLLSAVHMLNIEANTLVEEAADVLTRAGLQLGSLKKYHSNFVRCADMYFHEFATMITSEDKKMDMFSDMDEFDALFRKWAKLNEDKQNSKQA